MLFNCVRITFPLFSRSLFPSFLPSNPISHQISHRECLYYLYARLAKFMHERYEFNACSMHDKMQDSCMILAKIHCMIMHDLISWASMYLRQLNDVDRCCIIWHSSSAVVT